MEIELCSVSLRTLNPGRLLWLSVVDAGVTLDSWELAPGGHFLFWSVL